MENEVAKKDVKVSAQNNTENKNAVKHFKKKKNPNINLINYNLVNRSFFAFKEIIKNIDTFTSEEQIKDRMDKTIDEFVAAKLTEETHRNMSIQYLYAYKKIEELWNSDEAHNFIKHLFVAFLDKECQSEPTPNTKKNTLCAVTNLFVTSKSELDNMYDDFAIYFDELGLQNKDPKDYPSTFYKYIWTLTNIMVNGVYSKKSNKVLSFSTYMALKEYFGVLVKSLDKEAMTIAKKILINKNVISGGKPYFKDIKSKKMKTQSMGDFFTQEQIEKLKK